MGLGNTDISCIPHDAWSLTCGTGIIYYQIRQISLFRFVFRDPNISPGKQSLNEWPRYTPDGKEYLELNAKFMDEPDKSFAVGRALRARECAFWKNYLPNLIEKTESTCSAH